MLGRRRLLSGLGAGVSAFLGSRCARAAERRRVLIVGSSSMAGALGGSLERGLEQLGYEVLRRHRSASSLSRPDFFDWFDEARRLHASFRPHGSLVMFAANDAQALYTGSRPAWIQFHDEATWSRAYRERVRHLVDTLAPRGERVVWIGAPIMRSAQLSARMRRTNRIYEAEMQWRPSATFIDTWDRLADRRGRYADHLRVGSDVRRVRAPDGVHLARGGAQLLAELVVPHAHRFLSKGQVGRASHHDLACAAPHPAARGPVPRVVVSSTR